MYYRKWLERGQMLYYQKTRGLQNNKLAFTGYRSVHFDFLIEDVQSTFTVRGSEGTSSLHISRYASGKPLPSFSHLLGLAVLTNFWRL